MINLKICKNEEKNRDNNRRVRVCLQKVNHVTPATRKCRNSGQ